MGDTLAQGDLSREAFAHQRAMQAHRDTIRHATAFALATRDAVRMLDIVTAEHAA